MAKKKVTLPFVVAPRREPIVHTVGNEESGQIEITRKGYLSVAEKTFMQQATAGDASVGGLQRLASKVAREKGLQVAEVIELLSKSEFGGEIFEDYAEEINDLIGAMMVFEERRKIVAAACMLYFRISTEISIEETMELHPDLVQDLYQLYMMEEAKSTEGFESEEDVKPEGKE